MRQPISVHLLPDLCDAAALSGGTAVVIDILRASTTITTALFHGAQQVIPCLTIEDALEVRRQADPGAVLLGGERGGVQIVGFELSNSPADYSRPVVENRTIGFTTTNGTRALLHCRNAELILVGCFLNLSELTSLLRSQNRPVHLVCAGTNGQITGEDVLFAGAVVHQLLAHDDHGHPVSALSEEPTGWSLDDSSRLAMSYWLQFVIGDSGLSELSSDLSVLCDYVERSLRETLGGRNLLRLKYDADIGRCSQIDSAPIVPRFSSVQNNLTAEADSV